MPIATIRIDVDLAKSLSPVLDEHGRQRLQTDLRRLVDGLLEDLALPAQPALELHFDQDLAAPFQLSINGGVARWPRVPPGPPPASVRALAIDVAGVLHSGRAQLIDPLVAQSLREHWASPDGCQYLAGLARADFRLYLQTLADRCFRLDRGHHTGPPPTAPARWTVADCVDRATASFGCLRVVLHHGVEDPAATDPSLAEKLALMQDGLFYELGVRIPNVQVHEDSALERGEWQVQVNDLRLPPFAGLAPGEVLVNDTVERLKLLDISGRPSVNPANGTECAIVVSSVAQRCEGAGLTTWDASAYAVLAASARLRQHAASLVVADGVEYELGRLSDYLSDLVAAARARLPVATLTQVLRELVGEGISVRNLRGVLEALLAVRTMIEVDTSKNIVFTAYATAPCLASRPGVGDLSDPAILAECVRGQLRRYVSHLHSRGANTLVVHLLDPAIERRLMNSAADPLTPQERDRILVAVAEEVGGLPPTTQKPVILTTLESRRPLRRLIDVEFPHLAVLSYQELSPDLNIQPIARISWE